VARSTAERAIDPVIDAAGKPDIPEESLNPTQVKPPDLHSNIILQAETSFVLSYLEYLLIELQGTTPGERPPQTMQENIEDLRNIIETEGLLWKIEEIPENDTGVIRFQPLASEAMEDIDSQLQALAKDNTWRKPLQAYNAAYERYLDRDYDELIPKKLYNSVEEVLKTICVDEEGWTDNRDLNHSDYLEILKENDIYDANGITAPELNDLLQGLERLVAKLGNDRKQRHTYIDRTYCTLLIHQVGAFLYFLINRYEEYSKNQSS
jgi:hypothetical protein